MNILFLTLTTIKSISQKGIYTDLIRLLAQRNHVYALSIDSSVENAELDEEFENLSLIKCNVNSSRREDNILKKGIATLFLGTRITNSIKPFLSNVKIDLIIYATPPITLHHTISYFKKRDNAKTYLMLKDIFPQNAVDIGMLKKSGIKGLIYKYFRRKEKMLYRLSDRIGCMSQANVDYVLEHNAEVSANKIEVCPNSIEVLDVSLSDVDRLAMRQKYGIPSDKTVFVYGGNLGRPQGVPFVIDCLKVCKNEDAFFLIVGDGTEYGKLSEYIEAEKPQNVKLMKALPKDDYDRMLAACDVGLIFLDHRFTIPNFPSRLLSYMQARLPVLACTDVNTDIGSVITEGRFGWWCESNDANGFADMVEKIINSNTEEFEKNSWDYLNSNYDIEKAYMTIVKPEDKYSSESFAIAGR